MQSLAIPSGSSDGRCDFIRDLLAGNLRPAHRNPAIPGILDFEFRIEDVKRFRPTTPDQSEPLGFITCAVAAAQLGTITEVVRNLAAEGLLHCHRVKPGGIHLLRAADVERFWCNTSLLNPSRNASELEAGQSRGP